MEEALEAPEGDPHVPCSREAGRATRETPKEVEKVNAVAVEASEAPRRRRTSEMLGVEAENLEREGKKVAHAGLFSDEVVEDLRRRLLEEVLHPHRLTVDDVVEVVDVFLEEEEMGERPLPRRLQMRRPA